MKKLLLLVVAAVIGYAIASRALEENRDFQ